MNLKEKMLYILESFEEEKHRVEQLVEIDYGTNGKSKDWSLMLEGHEKEFLKSFIDDYDKDGEVYGFENKGYRVDMLDFRLISN